MPVRRAHGSRHPLDPERAGALDHGPAARGDHDHRPRAAPIAALVIGLINAIVRPILLVLTIPITILTLGLFLLVLNALLFWLAAEIVDGFAVAGFGAAFVGA